MADYITKQGDTWDVISLMVYGSEMFTDILINANLEHIDIAIFSANVNLKVPNINRQRQHASNLPPWKRNNAT